MRKTLRLRRETLHELSAGDLTGVVGAAGQTGPSCICPTRPGRLSCIRTCAAEPDTITCAETICYCTTG